eukprot:g3903.t1
MDSSGERILDPDFVPRVLQTFSAADAESNGTGALAEWLRANGLTQASEWGITPGSKPVSKLEEEIRLGETIVELWDVDGTPTPVRCVHVLRGKVCTAASRARGMFLMNTWQQTAKGEYRFRYGLLSEKLGPDELPLEKHLLRAGTRAVTAEEMERIAPKGFRLKATVRPGAAEGVAVAANADVKDATVSEPVYTPGEACPIEVEDVVWDEQTVEKEYSKSFPGLLTVYYLYTIDIVCKNLPAEDFNTLEYEEKKPGHHTVKYVHAWQWTPWDLLKLHLFEGSTCRERPEKFSDVGEMNAWLMRHGDQALRSTITNEWGSRNNGSRSVEELFDEANRGECSLELWSKRNGVPLIVRVVHVLRAKVVSSINPNYFLFNTFETTCQGGTGVGSSAPIGSAPAGPSVRSFGAPAAAVSSTKNVDEMAKAPAAGNPSATTKNEYKQVPRNMFLTEKLKKHDVQDSGTLHNSVQRAVLRRLKFLVSEEEFETEGIANLVKKFEAKRHVRPGRHAIGEEVEKETDEKGKGSFSHEHHVAEQQAVGEPQRRNERPGTLLETEGASPLVGAHSRVVNAGDGSPIVYTTSGIDIVPKFYCIDGADDLPTDAPPLGASTSIDGRNMICYPHEVDAQERMPIPPTTPQKLIQKMKLISRTHEAEQSRGYPGLLTVYHLYTVEVHQSGLPGTRFVSLETAGEKKSTKLRSDRAYHWRWASYPQVVDMLNRRSRFLESNGKMSESLYQTAIRTVSDKVTTLQKSFAELQTKLVPGTEVTAVNGAMQTVVDEVQKLEQIGEQIGNMTTQLPADVLQSCIPARIRTSHRSGA